MAHHALGHRRELIPLRRVERAEHLDEPAVFGRHDVRGSSVFIQVPKVSDQFCLSFASIRLDCVFEGALLERDEELQELPVGHRSDVSLVGYFLGELLRDRFVHPFKVLLNRRIVGCSVRLLEDLSEA